MTRERLRTWLLTGLNALAGVAALRFVLDDILVVRSLLDEGILVTMVFSVFLLTPVLLLAVYFLGQRTPVTRTRNQKVYTRLSVVFVTVCWLVTAPPAVFWGALIIAAREPWPLSLAQGPDTERAQTGVAKLFGTDIAAAMSSVYFYSFNVRDSSYFVRFAFTDPGVIERIARGKDLVKVPVGMLSNARYDVRAYRNRLTWWHPDEINCADTLYVDRPTSEKMSGDRPRREPTGFSRVLWVDRATRTAFYREVEF